MADIETLGILDEIQALVSDKLQVVSYKWLSRNFLVPSNTAKRLLQEFVEKNGSQLEVLYSLSGWLKNNPSVYHVKLVLSSKLSEAKEEFADSCSVQIYSVQASIPKDPALIWNAEFIQAEELFKEDPNVLNCLRDNRFCGVSNSYVKRNTDGTPVIKTSSIQEKKVEQSNPKPDKGKEVQNGSHKEQALQQEVKVKPVPQKEQIPQLPNKKKVQNEKSTSGTSGSLASMWGRASSKPKPETAPVKTENPIPVSNDAQVLANEMVEDNSSDDENEQMKFKRGSNGEGNNRKRRVVLDYSDEDDDVEKDVVSLASPDPPKKKDSVDLKKKSGLENKNLDFDEKKEVKVIVKKEKVSECKLKEDVHDKYGNGTSNEKDDEEQKNKGSNGGKNVAKKRKVLKTRIDERGREVTEVVWEDEEKETKSTEENSKKDKSDIKTTTNNVTNRPSATAPKKSPATGKAGNKKGGAKDPKQGNIMSFFKKK